MTFFFSNHLKNRWVLPALWSIFLQSANFYEAQKLNLWMKYLNNIYTNISITYYFFKTMLAVALYLQPFWWQGALKYV